MARALIVGCGCRGRMLGRGLLAEGWAVRGTTRAEAGLEEIASTGIEPALADPDRIGTVLEYVHDVTIVVWLLGSALGAPEALEVVHGPRLERLMEELVDGPVRGVVYEAAGSVEPHLLAEGTTIVRRAAATWRIPIEVVTSDPADRQTWTAAMQAAVLGLTA